MGFLIVVISLALLHYVHAISHIQNDMWFKQWVASATGVIKSPVWAFFVSLLLPIVLVFLIEYLLAGKVFGLIAFLFSLFVLLYSFGRGDLNAELEVFKSDLHRDDFQAAFRDAAVFNPAHQTGQANNPQELLNESESAISYRFLEHFFAVIFWYLVAGVAGALLYRLVQLYQENTYTDYGTKAAGRFLWILEWLPVRLVGVTLALVGSFISCFKVLGEAVFDFKTPSAQVLNQLMCGALDIEPMHEQHDFSLDIDAVQSLFQRALVAMVCLIALWVILI